MMQPTYTRSLAELPSVPVIATDSMRVDDAPSGQDRQRGFAAKERFRIGPSNFLHFTTEKSGNYITLDEPNLVIDGIMRLYSH